MYILLFTCTKKKAQHGTAPRKYEEKKTKTYVALPTKKMILTNLLTQKRLEPRLHPFAFL